MTDRYTVIEDKLLYAENKVVIIDLKYDCPNGVPLWKVRDLMQIAYDQGRQEVKTELRRLIGAIGVPR